MPTSKEIYKSLIESKKQQDSLVSGTYNIEMAIYNWYGSDIHHIKPSIIIIHPHFNWCKYMPEQLSFGKNAFDLKYKGIRIIRSYDVKEDEILIY